MTSTPPDSLASFARPLPTIEVPLAYLAAYIGVASSDAPLEAARNTVELHRLIVIGDGDSSLSSRHHEGVTVLISKYTNEKDDAGKTRAARDLDAGCAPSVLSDCYRRNLTHDIADHINAKRLKVVTGDGWHRLVLRVEDEHAAIERALNSFDTEVQKRCTKEVDVTEYTEATADTAATQVTTRRAVPPRFLCGTRPSRSYA